MTFIELVAGWGICVGPLFVLAVLYLLVILAGGLLEEYEL